MTSIVSIAGRGASADPENRSLMYVVELLQLAPGTVEGLFGEPPPR